MKKFFLFFIFIASLVVAGAWLFKLEGKIVYLGEDAAQNSAASVNLAFEKSLSKKDLIKNYQKGKLKVLIVPGHDNEFSGASYGGYDEADFNIEFARYLTEVLSSDRDIDVVLARDLVTGFYSKDILDYLDNHRDGIFDFRVSKKSLMKGLLANGFIEDRSNDNHAFAKEEILHRLYGINKWSNENNIDLIIHVHFNDYAGRKWNQPGKYSGLAVYVSDDQYPNGAASIALGQAVFKSLNSIRPTSTSPFEVAGVVPGQELVATGANATLDAASILIEYGFMYEPEFQNAVDRETVFKEMAKKTYEGLVEYLK